MLRLEKADGQFLVPTMRLFLILLKFNAHRHEELEFEGYGNVTEMTSSFFCNSFVGA
jgi:hypothetical protein